MKPPRQRRRLEREFGVPIAGEILDASQWTQTALKRLPETGPLDWQQLFGRKAPLVVDLGCGNGRFLLGSAVWRPDHDHVGVDILPAVLRYATRRGNQRGLANLRFAAVDGYRFLKTYVAAGSLREIHIYHPQPFHDPRDTARRLIEPGFLALAHTVLERRGTIWLQTDNAAYWQYMKEVVPAFFELNEQRGPWPDAPRGRTRREILALKRGLPVFRGSGSPRPLSADDLDRLASRLPRPIFDAGPRQRELDDMEAASEP